MQLSLLISVLCGVVVVESAKILGIFPVAAPSHYILGSALMRGLAEKGHDVTVVSPYGEKDIPKNWTYRDVILTGFKEEMDRNFKKMNMFDRESSNQYIGFIFFTKMMNENVEKTFAHPNFQKFLNSGEKFDVVIVEQFLNDAHKAIAAHFGAPLVTFSTIAASSWINTLVGNPSPLSYIPEIGLGFSADMPFCERISNTLYRLFFEALQAFYVHPVHNELVKKYLPNVPDFYEVLYNTSIVLLNSHPSLNQPVPHVPNMKEIGGFHIKPPKKLPDDLQKFLDDSKEGVVYFSMGSNLKSANLPQEKRDALLKTFSKLKLKVLWKWEEDVLPGQPPNVKLSKWLPQQDILAHPNVKLFITHGGLLSTTEAIYHGKQILAIPIFGDQKFNAKAATDRGYGLMVPYQELTEEKLTETIGELLTNPKYSQVAQKRSRIFHDRSQKPLDSAIYWVEYVVRHQGAPHFRVAGVDLPWYKYHGVDVIAFLAIVVLSSLAITLLVVKFICKRLCRKTTATGSKSKKQKTN